MSAALHERVLVITRVLNAAPELAFRAWTDVDHLVHWFGPKDFSVPHARMDARAGGEYRACIRSPEGAEYWMRGTFREVDPPRRLVFSWAWEDDDGVPGHETLVTVLFEPAGGRTRMTFRQEVFESVEQRDSHEGGWSECFDRLEAWLDRMETSV